MATRKKVARLTTQQRYMGWGRLMLLKKEGICGNKSQRGRAVIPMINVQTA
jgi:hypothetical protein